MFKYGDVLVHLVTGVVMTLIPGGFIDRNYPPEFMAECWRPGKSATPACT